MRLAVAFLAHPKGPKAGVMSPFAKPGCSFISVDANDYAAYSPGIGRRIKVIFQMNMPHSKCLVAWIGDDFTRSAASLEVMAFAGIPLRSIPECSSKSQMDLFPEARAIGSCNNCAEPESLTGLEHLPKYFGFLRELSPVISHYKVCSTLDSSPEIGSIGCA